jgi:hypothetical protein
MSQVFTKNKIMPQLKRRRLKARLKFVTPIFIFMLNLSSAYAQLDTLTFREVGHIPDLRIEDPPIVITGIYVKDILGDSDKELIVAKQTRICVYDAINSWLLWTSPFCHFGGDLKFQDVNNDNDIDIAEIDTDGVKLYDVTHSRLIWSSPHLPLSHGCYAIDDINADGFQDIIIVRRELLRNDYASDTAWIEIYPGPNFNLTGRTFFLVTGYNQNDCIQRENPISAVFADLSGDQGISHKLLIFTEVYYDSLFYMRPGYMTRIKYDGNLLFVDPVTLQMNKYEIGKMTSFSIMERGDSTYLFVLTEISDAGEVYEDSTHTFYNKSLRCLSSDGIEYSRTLWQYDTTNAGTWRNWNWENIADFSNAYPGDELCLSVFDTITLLTFPDLTPIWRRGADHDYATKPFLYKTQLYSNPQILCGAHDMMIYDGDSGEQSAIFNFASSPGFVADFNNDGEDEVLCPQGRYDIFIYHIVKYPEEIIDNGDNFIPAKFCLHINYPNPFNSATSVQYDLTKSEDVIIEIFDILGRKVGTLINSEQQAGHHQIIWDASDQSSGIYFYRLKADDYTETKKMLLLK